MEAGNVIPIQPGGLPSYDVELIEMIALMFGSRDLPIWKMHVSTRSIDSYIEKHGAPDGVSMGFVFPVYRWRLPELGRRHRVIIDQGAKRIEFLEQRDPFDPC